MRFVHKNCRSLYPGTSLKRFNVPDDYVSWDKEWKDYNPVEYTSTIVLSQPIWADLDFMKDKDSIKSVKWNSIDGNIDRTSHEGNYKIENTTSLPLNPFGRTGMKGRGLLGRWGPNHAADPIVTRYVL